MLYNYVYLASNPHTPATQVIVGKAGLVTLVKEGTGSLDHYVSIW